MKVHISPQKKMVRNAVDYQLLGTIVTHQGAKTIRLKEIGDCYQDARGRLFNKQTGRRPMDSMTGDFLKVETVRSSE